MPAFGKASASGASELRASFEQVAAQLAEHARAGEYWSIGFEGEASEFVRITRARLRQSGQVERMEASIRAVIGERQAVHRLSLSGLADLDREQLGSAVALLRASIAAMPPDPHLLLARGAERSSFSKGAGAPAASELAARMLDAAEDQDLVGILASGPIARGFASSEGAQHWFESESAVADFSIHLPSGRALKRTLAGTALESEAMHRALVQCRRELHWLGLPEVAVEPGRYRALLEPAAMAELVGMLGWGGFSIRAQRSGQSPLARLYDGSAQFDARLTIRESPERLDAPRFQSEGFLRPEALVLVRGGDPGASLVCPRSAREFGLEHNGAENSEAPVALAVDGGTLAQEDALSALGDGLWIGNLWYLNWSDRAAARLTGMTRFGSFLVRDGEVAGPLARARFDDSLYRILGSELLALGDTPYAFVDPSAYERRDPGGIQVPSALVGALRIAL